MDSKSDPRSIDAASQILNDPSHDRATIKLDRPTLVLQNKRVLCIASLLRVPHRQILERHRRMAFVAIAVYQSQEGS
jgi:hypothetical protein